MNTEYEKKIGKKLRLIRENCGLTQEQASAKLQTFGCDITRSALAKIEVGQRHIYPDEIYYFSKIYNTPYSDIFVEIHSQQI